MLKKYRNIRRLLFAFTLVAIIAASLHAGNTPGFDKFQYTDDSKDVVFAIKTLTVLITYYLIAPVIFWLLYFVFHFGKNGPWIINRRAKEKEISNEQIIFTLGSEFRDSMTELQIEIDNSKNSIKIVNESVNSGIIDTEEANKKEIEYTRTLTTAKDKYDHCEGKLNQIRNNSNKLLMLVKAKETGIITIKEYQNKLNKILS